MEPEIKRLLEETHALAKENHRILRAIRRDQWISFFGRIIIWIIVLVLPKLDKKRQTKLRVKAG